MELRFLRVSVLSAATVCLIAAHIGDALPVYGGEPSPTVVKDHILLTPPDDIRLPEHRPITSPGFPSELSGMCLTWQDCLDYCKTHQSESVCGRLIKDPVDREIYHDLGMALQKSGDLAYAEYTAASGARDICEPDMRQAAETVMSRYREASSNLKRSLPKTGDQALTEKDTLISIDTSMLTVYRIKDRLDRECCQGCRGIKPKGTMK